MPPLPSNSPHCTGPSQDLHMHFCHDLSTPDPPCSSHPSEFTMSRVTQLLPCYNRTFNMAMFICQTAASSSVGHALPVFTHQTRRALNMSSHVKRVAARQTRRHASKTSSRIKHVAARQTRHCIAHQTHHIVRQMRRCMSNVLSRVKLLFTCFYVSLHVPLCVPRLTHYVRIWLVLFRVIQQLPANHCLTVTACAGRSTQSHDLPVQRNITCIWIHCMWICCE